MHYQKPKKNHTALVIALVLVVAIVLGLVLYFVINNRGSAPARSTSASLSPAAQSGVSSSASIVTPSDYVALPLPEEMRGMWISFLEWQKVDISTEEKMRSVAGEMFDNCAAMGLNTVIIAVRPFGDALYNSSIYPWSHLITGTQGQDPGYDPLAVMVEEAHARNLRIEAWINPYRAQSTASGMQTLSADNPAVIDPSLAHELDGSIWYDPGLPEVQQMVIDGAAEIAANYDVDGIHFDDYFYPEFTAEQKEAGRDLRFDEAAFAQYGGNMGLAEWRRNNVNTMVQGSYDAIKAANPSVSFGISVQGNNENNYNSMYADVREWMAAPGYVDYVMPQLYWGFAYRTASGRDAYAFENICATWASYYRAPEVRLYAGLGAYRIGVGDGGNNDQSEWETGHNLADMVEYLRTVNGFSGFALFRYDFLYRSDDPLAGSEVTALTAVLQ